jgi:cytochrome b6
VKQGSEATDRAALVPLDQSQPPDLQAQPECFSAFTTFPPLAASHARVYRWFDDRLDIKAIQDDISSKYVPPHVNIFYCFGGLVFTSFIIQAATGVAMTFYYVPDVARALVSVESLAFEVTNGWVIRSMHRWTASLMVCFFGLTRLCRVYLTGGFKKPRELTWLTGIVLAVLTVSFGVTGYSLPFPIKQVTGPYGL